MATARLEVLIPAPQAITTILDINYHPFGSFTSYVHLLSDENYIYCS